jgi:hypothetical protein
MEFSQHFFLSQNYRQPQNQHFFGCELIKPPKKWKPTPKIIIPKTISPKMAEIMPPQNWYGQSKIA